MSLVELLKCPNLNPADVYGTLQGLVYGDSPYISKDVWISLFTFFKEKNSSYLWSSLDLLNYCLIRSKTQEIFEGISDSVGPEGSLEGRLRSLC